MGGREEVGKGIIDLSRSSPSLPLSLEKVKAGGRTDMHASSFVSWV